MAGWLRKHPAFGRAALACIPDRPHTIDVPPIGPLRIRLRRHRSYWLRDPLTHERFVLGALKRLIHPGDVVFDVGANIGLHLRIMAGPFNAGRIVAFEPMTENRELLQRNIELGEFGDRVRILPMALSDHDGAESLQIDDVRSGSAALNTVTGGKPSKGREQYGLPARTEEVRIARLDALMSAESLPAPNVMKIDIEGAEVMMLRGALQTLRTHRPRLAIEVHGLDLSRDVLLMLGELDYQCFGNVVVDGSERYAQLTPALIDSLKSRWDLLHIIASADVSDVREPIQPFMA